MNATPPKMPNNVAVMRREFEPLREILNLYVSANDAVTAGNPEVMRQIAELAATLTDSEPTSPEIPQSSAEANLYEV